MRATPGFRLELITPDGETLDLHNPPNRAVLKTSGWGMSAHQRSSTRGPFQQGSSVLSQRLDERTISLTLRHNGCSKSSYFNHRGLYVDYLRENRVSLFSPRPNQLIYHYIEDGVYKSRAADVYLEDGFGFTPPQTGVWDNFAIQEELTFVAHDPLLYDPTINTNAFATFDSELILPMTFPFVLGGYDTTQTITYTGTWETYPNIILYGPLKNVSIINLSTNKRINYAGEVVAGNPVTFDLSYDEKTVEDSCGNNLSAYASGDIGNFSIQCAPMVAGGANSIRISVEAADFGTARVVLQYYTRYRGI